MDYNSQYRLALVVGGLLLSGILFPAAYYLKKGSFAPANAFTTKGCLGGGCGGSDNDVCKTKACKNIASRILDYMDDSVDKCQNFYKYACGKFIKTAKIKDDQGYISSETEVDLKLNQRLKVLLEKKPKKGDPPSFTKVRQLYSLCMDEKKIKTQGLGPIKDFLKKAGGWPVLDTNWDPTGWDISQTILQLRRLGGDANGLFKLVVVDEGDKLAIHINKPEMRLPPQFILQGGEHEFVKLHYEYMNATATLLGAEISIAEEDMADVYKLEMFLAHAILKSPEQGGGVFAYPVSYLDSEMPFLNWGTLLQAIPSSHPNRDENIAIYNMDFINYLDKVILPQFDPRIIMNYIMWHAVSGLTHLLTDKDRESEFNFEKNLYGLEAKEPRWRECVGVANKMTYALSSLYIGEYYSESIKTTASGITRDIHNELKHTIKQVDWMDQETKVLAYEKADKMELNIGFTQRLKLNDWSTVEAYYEGLKIDQNSYFQAFLDVERWKINRGQKYESVLADSNGLDDMTKVNALYIKTKNSLHVPASYMMPPYFTAGVPNYVNYGTLGMIIGHEMTHGFDERGKMFSADGSNKEWWDENSSAAFAKKTECMVNQFNEFVESETQTPLDGLKTLNENIADSGGLKLAYRAYKKLEKTLAKPEQGLPGLQKFDNDQLFFLAIANRHCSTYRPEVLQATISQSDHSLNEFRLIGSLMNLPEFGNVFGCEEGTPMNPKPENRCDVW